VVAGVYGWRRPAPGSVTCAWTMRSRLTQALFSRLSYCLQMFEDAIKAKEKEETVKARDIAELVNEAC